MSKPSPEADRPLAQPWPKGREPAGHSVFWKFATVALVVLLFLGFGGRWAFLKAWNNWVLIASSSNLRQIGLALHLYAHDHDGQLPSDWAQLLLDPGIELTSDVFVNGNGPWNDDSWHALSKPEQAKLITMPGSMHCTYVFTAAGLTLKELPPDAVLAFEPSEAHDDRGALVLLTDGTSELVDVNAPPVRAAYQRLIADVARGVRPVRWQVSAATTTAPATTSSASTLP